MRYRSNLSLGPLIAIVSLLGLTTRMSWAIDLDVYSLPTTAEVFEGVSPSAVRVDVLTPYTAWLTGTETINRPLVESVSGRRIAVLVVKVTDPAFPEESLSSFIGEAQDRAARYGANMICVERPMTEQNDSGYVSVTFNAYRVSYQGRLIPPRYLAALPNTPVDATLLHDDIQAWEDKFYGRDRVSFMRGAGEDGREVVRYFDSVKRGLPVRLVLKDGSDFRGAFSGLGADDEIWIHPKGFAGLLSDRSFRAKDVIAVSLLN